MKQRNRASKRRAPNMAWRLDLIRTSHKRILAKKATAIEMQQAQAKTARADERQHQEEQVQTKTYILAILMRQQPVAIVSATA